MRSLCECPFSSGVKILFLLSSQLLSISRNFRNWRGRMSALQHQEMWKNLRFWPNFQRSNNSTASLPREMYKFISLIFFLKFWEFRILETLNNELKWLQCFGELCHTGWTVTWSDTGTSSPLQPAQLSSAGEFLNKFHLSWASLLWGSCSTGLSCSGI